MIKKTLIALVVIVAALVVVIAMQPSSFRIERSAKVTAPPAAVFEHVNDFRKWNAWSPWDKLDPNMERKFDGPEAGEGAVYSWAGNSDVGEGKMTIVESKPAELVLINLEFIKPMEATNESRFDFKPEDDGTLVTWSMKGENNFIGKAFCLVMDMDKMVGDKFEEGLASLKKVSETGGATPAASEEPSKDQPAATAEPAKEEKSE